MEKIMENRTMLSTIELVNLSKGKFAIIDIEESDLVNQYKWCINDKQNNNYAIATKVIDNIRHSKRMHRVIMRVTDPSIIIDHINHNGLDNRKSNLRRCTFAENVKHTSSRIGSNSAFLGVSFKKQRTFKMYVAQIQCDKKKFHIGYFDTDIEAALAYNKRAKELFGEFANLNQI
jgi:hypothetical protein